MANVRAVGESGGAAGGTRERILTAAAEVFAERGFREATTRLICQAAGVNVALVNYYFRSKAELYKAVIGELFREVAEPLLSLPGSVRDAASWQAAMRAWVRRSLEICAAVRPPESHIARLMGLEEQVPAEVMEELMREFAEPIRLAFGSLVRMGMEGDDPVEVSLWHSSVSAQYVVYALAKPSWVVRFCPAGVSREAWLERASEHICGDLFARLSYRPGRA